MARGKKEIKLEGPIGDKVLYRHLKPNGEVFYIGIGDKYRPNSKKRSKWWKRIVDKYGYEIEILKRNITWEEACEYEKILISWYGRLDKKTGTLVNMTDGGDGSSGYILTEETRRKISEAGKGRKMVFTDKWKENLSNAGKGRKLSQESIDKMIMTNKQRRPIIIDGIEYISISEASRKLGISRASINNGIYKKSNDRIIIDDIEYDSITEASRKLGIGRTTLQYRIKNNLIKWQKDR